MNRSFRITADIDVPQGGGSGMLVTQGGRFAGWGFYLLQGRPVFTMNLLDIERVKWEGTQALTPGRHTLVFDFTISPEGPIPFGHGGTGVLTVDGQQVATRAIPRSTPFTFAWDETFDVGQDTGTPVDDRDYQVPALFTGRINRITVDLGDTLVTPEAIRNFGALMAQRAAAEAAARERGATPAAAPAPAQPARPAAPAAPQQRR
jgi:arylsulfatase